MNTNDVLTSIQDEDAETPVLEEFETYAEQALAVARTVPEECFRRNGLLAWYGDAYEVDDLIVNVCFRHKCVSDTSGCTRPRSRRSAPPNVHRPRDVRPPNHHRPMGSTGARNDAVYEAVPARDLDQVRVVNLPTAASPAIDDTRTRRGSPLLLP